MTSQSLSASQSRPKLDTASRSVCSLFDLRQAFELVSLDSWRFSKTITEERRRSSRAEGSAQPRGGLSLGHGVSSSSSSSSESSGSFDAVSSAFF